MKTCEASKRTKILYSLVLNQNARSDQGYNIMPVAWKAKIVAEITRLNPIERMPPAFTGAGGRAGGDLPMEC
ncbi:hypothetical protein ACFE6N_06795 [Pedobacter sp. BG31]|uniref:hypothetical protein n=1 Tax=Pedobacter sp. BG31 TaxID=3349697 RepID=UPI0035F3866F